MVAGCWALTVAEIAVVKRSTAPPFPVSGVKVPSPHLPCTAASQNLNERLRVQPMRTPDDDVREGWRSPLGDGPARQRSSRKESQSSCRYVTIMYRTLRLLHIGAFAVTS